MQFMEWRVGELSLQRAIIFRFQEKRIESYIPVSTPNLFFMNLILVALLIVVLAFAWWQNRRAIRTRRTLEKELGEAPAKIVSALRTLTRASQDRSAFDFVGGGE